MLTQLQIKNYAIISDLTIDFYGGLSIITGETGAGKSILLGALGLVTGSRADTNILFDKDEKCIVEAHFDVGNYNLEQIFTDNDIDYDSKTIIRREILPGGKSRAFINDTPVNVSVLKEIGDNLIDIHSQHENMVLSSPLFQLQILDVLADNYDLLEKYKEEYLKLNQLVADYKQLKEDSDKNKAEYDYNFFQYNELKAAQLKSGEQEELEDELNMLKNAEEITSALGVSINNLNDEELGVLYRLKESFNSLDKIAKYLPHLKEVFERFNSSYLELKDIALELEQNLEKVNLDPDRLRQLEDRVDLIFRLQQKHAVSSIDELITIYNALEEKINQVTESEDILIKVEQNIKQAQNKVKQHADELHKNRSMVISVLQKKVLEILIQVGMPHSRFEISLNTSDDYNAQGNSNVLFLFSANLNGVMSPIAKVASGGERSRFMLGLKAVLASHMKLPTIIFDEIDTGVSGEIADKVGNIMQIMSQYLQVINITHLPQVAGKGKNHYKVFKEVVDGRTNTKINLLNVQERREEIAKMLSGSELTEAALHNADELLKQSD